MQKLTGREEGGPMGEGMGAVTRGMLSILLVIVIGLFFVCQAAKAADWVATWNENTEVDLSGYFISIDGGPKVNVGNVTEYRFSAGDSVCAQLWAQDLAGNLSDPSVLVCVKLPYPPPPEPPVITPCDTD